MVYAFASKQIIYRHSLHDIAIDLSRNRLAKVTNGAFNNLTNLTHLDLSYNKLVRLDPASVEPLKNLQYLNISANLQMDLIDIKDTFQVSCQSFNY